ncbi:peroxide stress protein YaaA [Campylobacter upsaliensis]|nr:peroxide stress protein YaaA [Campylobacter upsaliensis]
MKILFSPSESKDLNCSLSPFDESSFIFRELFKFRLEALKNYENYIKNATQEDLQKLFGVIRACDTLPFYKFKQGAKLKDFNVEYFYKKHFSKALDKFLNEEEVLDLRAGFYDKFYTPKKKVSTYKFLKNGKIVSHYAKAYRGILLRIAAQNQALSNKELLAKLPSNLKLKDIKEFKLKEEITLEIVD